MLTPVEAPAKTMANATLEANLALSLDTSRSLAVPFRAADVAWIVVQSGSAANVLLESRAATNPAKAGSHW